MLYIHKTQNSNGTHASQITSASINNADWLPVPQELQAMAIALLPFVNITVTDGAITAVTDNATARAANTPSALETARTAVLIRIDGKCSAAIASGVTVGGKHYKLTAVAQQNLATAKAKGTSVIFAADGEEPTLHTAEQITAISDEAYKWGIVNTSYYAKLKVWIARETDVAVLNGIDYGTMLPTDLMQELSTLLAGVGINLANYASLLNGGN